jgi:hypothetical protein
MVRGCHGGSQRGARGGGTTPSKASAPWGSNPQGEYQVFGKNSIFVMDVDGMKMSFQGNVKGLD